MITALTKEQINTFPQYVAKWIAIGIDTTPIDRSKIKDQVADLYKCGGLEPPKTIKIFSGPVSAMIAVNIHEAIMNNPKQQNEKKTVYKKRIMKIVHDSCYYTTCGFGQQDAGWLSFYDFFRNEFQNDQNLCNEINKLKGIYALSNNANWYWTFPDIIFISEKHYICKLDDNNLIHNDKGPAIAYHDGTEIYAINGVVVPKYVVMNPENITTQDIENENNDEIRRVKIERFGVSKYLDEMKADIVSMDMIKVTNDPDSPAMPRALIKTKRGQYLVGTDGSTKRTYYMRVIDSVTTPSEAHESISPLPESNIIASS